jgi:hypothetical protein
MRPPLHRKTETPRELFTVSYLFFHRFFCPWCFGVLYEMTTENDDLRGQFVLKNHGTPRQKKGEKNK